MPHNRADSVSVSSFDTSVLGTDAGLPGVHSDIANAENDHDDDSAQPETESREERGSGPPATMAFADLFGNERRKRKSSFRTRKKWDR